LSKQTTINVTIRTNEKTAAAVKEISERLNTTCAQVYKWLIDGSLEIVQATGEPELPATLGIMRGLKSKQKKLN